MSSPLSAEQLDQLLPGTKEIMLQYFNDQTIRLDDMRAKYERLRLDSGMSRNVMWNLKIASELPLYFMSYIDFEHNQDARVLSRYIAP